MLIQSSANFCRLILGKMPTIAGENMAGEIWRVLPLK